MTEASHEETHFSAKRGNNQEAIRLFAEQICFASSMEGTESIGSASGYFNIATVIDDKMAKASLFNKGRHTSFQPKLNVQWLVQIKDHFIFTIFG